jgi:Ulp1 family protease
MTSIGYINNYQEQMNLKASDLAGLEMGNKINDEVMNYYITDNIAKRHESIPLNLVFCNTFLFTQVIVLKKNMRMKWWNKLNFREANFVFIPVHQAAHWKLLIMDQKNSKIFLLDSINLLIDDEDLKFVSLILILFLTLKDPFIDGRSL